jgi:hypothetical protein
MNTTTINDKAFARYAKAVQYPVWYYSNIIKAERNWSLTTRNASGNQLECRLEWSGTIKGVHNSKPIFSMHKRNHKLFYAIVAKLRDVLAQLLNPAPVAKYNDALACVDGDWPAQLYTPAPATTPAAAVGVQAQMAAIANKGKDKYAAVTERILANDKPYKDTPKSRWEAASVAKKSKGINVPTNYRDSLRETVREAGI